MNNEHEYEHEYEHEHEHEHEHEYEYEYEYENEYEHEYVVLLNKKYVCPTSYVFVIQFGKWIILKNR